MGVTKVSVSVDDATLREARKLAGKGVSLSSIFDAGLQSEVHRMRMLALLNDMERTTPLTQADRESGERLWHRIESSSTPVPSRRSRKKKGASA